MESVLSEVTLQVPIVGWSCRDHDSVGEGERHDVAVVVIGVFADQVDSAGSGPDSRWLPASPRAECLDEGTGVAAHLMHCIGEDGPTTSGRGRGP